MRYIVADERPLSLDDVRRALAGEEEDYEIHGAGTEANLGFEGRIIAEIAIAVSGDRSFDAERAKLIESADQGEGPGKATVLETLTHARSIFAVQVLFDAANA